MFALVIAIFCFIPILAISFFIYSSVNYKKIKEENKKNPGTHSEEKVKYYRLRVTVSSIIAGVLATVVIAYALLMFSAIAFM